MFVAMIYDDRSRWRVRKEQMRAHLDYLEREKDRILVAGTLRDDPNERPKGAMWIIEAPDKEEAESVCKSDPFFTGGLRKSISVQYWSKAFPDRKTPV